MRLRMILAGFSASLAATLLIGTLNANAEELSHTELVSRLTELETEVQMQRADLVGYHDENTCDQRGYLNNCQSGCGCSKSAFFAGYEVTFLKPYISDNEFGGGWGDRYGTGHRFTLGYDGGSGLGARLRYWMYNHNHETASGNPFLHIDMDVLDAELTLKERLRNWDLLLSGGVRYGRAAFDFGAGDLYFEGTGPTVSLEAVRTIGTRGLYLVGNFRTSMLFGDNGGSGANFQQAHDETAIVLDNQLGLGWSRRSGYGVWNVRGVWESQYWYNNSLGDDVFGFSSALAFAGPSFSIELQY